MLDTDAINGDMQETPQFVYKLQLSYKGTQYRGWQFQTQTHETVQEYVEKVIQKIAKDQKIKLSGASRTDTGVHASGQTLKVTLTKKIDPQNLMKGMNTTLPNDIRVVSCEFAQADLNVSLDCKSKEYHYYFTVNKKQNALVHEAVYPYSENLNIEKMQKACTFILGENNFFSFSNPRLKLTSPNRVITDCSIEKTSFLTMEKDVYYLKIIGPGFLRYMVRYLMGALWSIGAGELSLEDFQLSLQTGEEYGLRTKAPARGLHLIHIEY